MCIRRARYDWQWVFSYFFRDTHGLGSFLHVLSWMCILSAFCDPDWRSYSKKPMAAWAGIFSYDVDMILCVESKCLAAHATAMVAP